MTDAAIALRDTPFASVTVEQSVAIVMIDRPERRNALHPDAHRALHTVFDTLPEDPAIRAVIVTGRGDKAFCSGYDLKDNLETGEMYMPETGFGGLAGRVDYPLPLIAAINGIAFGGGFEMALACDFIVAAQSASFALPEPKVGWPAFSGYVRLPRAIGMKRAMDIILTGRAVSASEGKELGFVSEVVADSDLPAAARRWADQIVACAPLALRCAKQLAYGSFDQPTLQAALDERNYDTLDKALNSEDAIEGKRAFAERRKPNWTGR